VISQLVSINKLLLQSLSKSVAAPASAVLDTAQPDVITSQPTGNGPPTMDDDQGLDSHFAQDPPSIIDDSEVN
jgi:hypothetical protein